MNYNEIKGKSDFLKKSSGKKDIWLMNNHKYAFYIWEKYKLEKKINNGNTLIHIDYHWDAVNEFEDDKTPELLKIGSGDELQGIINDRKINLDSFIAPSIIRETISQVYFFCFQDDIVIKGFKNDFLEKYKTRQKIYPAIEKLIKDIKGDENLLLDIDLDIFNKNTGYLKGELWEEDEIIIFFKKLKRIKENSLVTTVALSPGYSGEEKDTEYLFNLCLEHFVL